MATIPPNIETLDRVRFELRQLISARLLGGGFLIGDSVCYHRLVAVEAAIVNQDRPGPSS